MDIFGNEGNNPFDQDLNTYDNVDFTRVDVSGAIVDNSQLATKLYVDTHGGGGGGGGNMNYVGTTPATNYIYKASTADGKNTVKSNIVDTGATVTVITTLQCLALDGQAMGGNLNIGNNQATVTILADCIADKFAKSGGLATDFLKGNGSVDTTTYLSTTAAGTTYATIATVTPLAAATQNMSAVAGTTTMSGMTIAGQLRYVSTVYSGPGGDMTIGGIGNNVTISAGQNIALSATNGVSINKAVTASVDYAGAINIGAVGGTTITIGRTGQTTVVNSDSLTANMFVKSSGLSTQFLKADGTVDATTYLSVGTPGIAAGYPFNPVWRATATITASTKSYWFVVQLNQATLISGFNVYLDSGSDVFRMGIYRGKVSAGGTTMTLCGQSAGGALPTIDIYARVAITAVVGQNLSFASGEYMTIAFHSQGSTNVFLTGQVTTGTWVELGYNSTANYAAAGFPATLNSTSVLGAIPNRPCFELY